MIYLVLGVFFRVKREIPRTRARGEKRRIWPPLSFLEKGALIREGGGGGGLNRGFMFYGMVYM